MSTLKPFILIALLTFHHLGRGPWLFSRLNL
uniref:Uncharacterized protein n=1 Tax=Vitis vinifera TaxID=29760 RepID=F6HBN3_VITVI